jgi:O-antigen ligase
MKPPVETTDQQMQGLYALRLGSLWNAFVKEHFSFWMTCGYLFFEYVRPQSIYPALDFLPWAQLFLLLAAGGWVLDPKSHWVASPAHKWMILFLLITIASIFFAVYPEAAKKDFMPMFTWFVVYFVLVQNTNNRQRLYILTLIFLLASFKLSLSLAIKWAARGFSFTTWGLQGPPGYFTNSGELSIQMLVFAPMAFHLYYFIKPHLSKFKRFLMLLMPITAAMTVVGASSRGAQIGLVYQVYDFFLKKRLSIRSILVTVLAGFLVWQMVPAEQKQRFTDIGNDRTSEQRLLYWKRGMEMIEDHPVLGVGLNNFPPYFQSHYRKDMLYETAQLPHNIFIQVGTDSGLLGLSAYLMLIISIFRANARTRKMAVTLGDPGGLFTALSRGLDTGTVGFLIAGQFVTVGYYPFIWANLAFSVALNSVCAREAKNANDAATATSPAASRSNRTLKPAGLPR